jgi:hypothetical protein
MTSSSVLALRISLSWSLGSRCNWPAQTDSHLLRIARKLSYLLQRQLATTTTRGTIAPKVGHSDTYWHTWAASQEVAFRLDGLVQRNLSGFTGSSVQVNDHVQRRSSDFTGSNIHVGHVRDSLLRRRDRLRQQQLVSKASDADESLNGDF